MLEEQQVLCPYCGESFTLFVDVSQGNHRTIEDCYVCCRPIEFVIEADGGAVQRVDAFSDDEVGF